MNKNKTREKSQKPSRDADVMNCLAKLYQEAVDAKEYLLCDILRLEIKRCVSKKKLLIPTGHEQNLLA